MIKVTVLFDNLGPYHAARLSALAKEVELTVIELHERSAEYDWNATLSVPFARKTLERADQGFKKMAVELREALSLSRPQAVFVPGWSSAQSLVALNWCGERDVPAIVMSDSQEIDSTRVHIKEWVKRRLVTHTAGALVGGKSHLEYATSLGISPNRIYPGYDVVDNTYFERGAYSARANADALRYQFSLPRSFFLASARFIKKKNIPLLLEAYASSRSGTNYPDLILLGDGPLRPAIEARIDALGLNSSVHMPGFIQYPVLPVYYGLALGFVHASTTEQWGLVVNEAMASGLPVIVSRACGCASELVHEGINGFLFDPHDVLALSNCLKYISEMPSDARYLMGKASENIIEKWNPEIFSTNAFHLVKIALSDKPQIYSDFNMILNNVVARLRNWREV